MRDFTGLLKLAYITFDRVSGRVVDAHPFGIGSGGSKTGNRSDTPYSYPYPHPNRSRIPGNILALSSIAVPILTYKLFKNRGAKVSKAFNDAVSRHRRLLPFSDFRKAYMAEQELWRKAGKTLENPKFAEIVSGEGAFDSLSHLMYDVSSGKGHIRLGVKNIRDAYRNGVDYNSFWHELGHTRDAYKHLGTGVWDVLRGKILSKFMPLKYNPMYNEELRAWNNALKFTNGGIDKDVMDAALATYRSSIHGSQATIGAGLGSAAVIGSRFFGNENKQ